MPLIDSPVGMSDKLPSRKAVQQEQAAPFFVVTLTRRRIEMLSASRSIPALLLPVVLLTGCPQVPYNPATTTDTTKPSIALRIEGAGPNAIEATNWIPGQPQNRNGTAHPDATLKLLATATDNESGIKEIRLNVLRTVKYVSSSGSVVDNRMASAVVDSKSYTLNNGQAPSIGVIQLNVVPRDQFVFLNNGQTVVGVGVVLEYNVEAKNQNGLWDHTERLVISSGRLQ